MRGARGADRTHTGKSATQRRRPSRRAAERLVYAMGSHGCAPHETRNAEAQNESGRQDPGGAALFGKDGKAGAGNRAGGAAGQAQAKGGGIREGRRYLKKCALRMVWGTPEGCRMALSGGSRRQM